MPKYVDFYVYPVPKKNVALCRREARGMGRIWRANGILKYAFYLADDVKSGRWTSYPQGLKLRSNEVVMIEHHMFKSRRHRDRTIKRVLADPRFAPYMDREKRPLPFDGRRVVKGGFKIMVDV